MPASRPARQGIAHDLLGLADDGLEVLLVPEALCVDLVVVLRPGRPCREPAAPGHDLEAPDRASLPGAWVSLAMMGSPARSNSWTAAGESFCGLAFLQAWPAHRCACSRACRTPLSSKESMEN